MKKRLLASMLATVMILTSIITPNTFVFAAENDTIVENDANGIPDINLYSVMLNTGDTNGDGMLTVSELEAIDKLDASDLEISNIKGLEYCKNLYYLDLSDNNITELDSIKDLTNLDCLYLYGNEIKDLTPLENLTELSLLYLSDTNTSDITALSNLKKLESLWLDNNEISDISPLSGLTDLINLYINNNQITDVSPLSELVGILNLYINNNQVTDISCLSSLTNLQALKINNNQINNIDVVSKFKNLLSLEADNIEVKDISAIKDLTNLVSLDLEGNELADLLPITELVNLEYLYIGHTGNEDISCLSDLVKLKTLSIWGNEIENIDVVSNFKNLTKLDAKSNNISDISALSNLNNLTYLDLSYNEIEDFSPIEGKNIKYLNIANQRSYDLSQAEVSLSTTNYTYDGTEKKPYVTVELEDELLTEGTDYTISYTNNIAVGTATVTITGTGSYTGTQSKTYTISPASINDATVALEKTSYTYDGKAKKPAVTVKLGNKTLTAGTDYTVTYKNNKNIGEATITITGKGNYTGTITKTFAIEAKKGATFTSGKYKFQVTDSSTVAFAGIKSTKTTKVNIPETVEYGGVTFKVTSIVDNALKGKTKVTSVTIPSTVTKIGKKAFYGCKNLKTITINAEKLTKIGSNALKGINSNATIKIPTEKYSSYGKLLKDKGQGSKVSIVVNAEKGDTFTSGNNKYKVTGSSTVEFTGLKSTKKTEVNIPKTVKYGGKTFKVTAIAEKALKGNTKVKIITVGENVKEIGASAFYGCKNLKTITIKSTKLETVGKNAFKKINSKATIKVPKSKLTRYEKLLKGKGQGSKVKIVKYK